MSYQAELIGGPRCGEIIDVCDSGDTAHERIQLPMPRSITLGKGTVLQGPHRVLTYKWSNTVVWDSSRRLVQFLYEED